MEYKFYLEGLDCANCTQKLEDRINKNKDIEDCTINFANGLMTFTSNHENAKSIVTQIIQDSEPDVVMTEKKQRTRRTHKHEHHEGCGCGHNHEHHHHEHEHECGCGHEHHEHNHEECGCGHEHHEHHHHEHDHECGCGHDHEHHHEHEHECGCGHEHHEHHHEHHHECGCGHDHEHHHHHEEHNHEECGCGCGHNHHEHHHDHEECSCGCGHDHEHHHHHDHDHECGCGCGHDHHHEVLPERQIQGAIKLHIHGLDCANCAMKVENEIKKLDIIDDALINFSTEMLLVRSSQQDGLVEKIQKVVDSVETGVTVSQDTPKEIVKPKLFDFKENMELVQGVIILIAANIAGGWFSTFLFYSAYLLIGYKVILKALKNVGRKDFLDENFLMCIATIGALILKDYNEAIAVMLFYAIGEIFQGYAVNKTRSSISSLMDIKSEYANLLVDGQIQQVEPEEVEIGDIVVVKVGEKVPLDGIIVDGETSFDTSSLTGESLPRHAQTGDEVLSGVVNLSEVIQLKVTQVYEDSTVSRILDLVENSASKKAKIEKFITRFAKVYTPAVVLCAVLLLFVPMLILENQEFSTWLYRACTFLVVSCPCALVISIPLGLYAGLGKASAIGVLIKGGNYLELLKDVDTVVFDKTGTLTKGEFHVVEISDDSLLEIGAYGEAMSNHPIARSIVQQYKGHIDYSRISDFKEIAGKGIEVSIDGTIYHLGNDKYFKELGIETQTPKELGTIVHIGTDHYLGYIVVADIIKESTIEGMKNLKRFVKKTVMLTGDHSEIAQNIASKIGINEVRANLLPQDKVTELEKILDDQHVVAYVGDGINDAPVLARSDLGIAMGGVGSDVAIEAADMVLMTDDINTLAKAIDVSKFTHVILNQNVYFTLIIKIGVLILTLFGYTNMWMGVFADVGVTLIAICNSMRILYKK